MALVLDAGALIAYERADRTVIALLEDAQRNGVPVRTSAATVAQVWRSGNRQARVGRLLRGLDQRSLDPAAARRIGELLGVAGTLDVVDAAIVDLMNSGDEILTSDPYDIANLAAAAGRRVSVIRV